MSKKTAKGELQSAVIADVVAVTAAGVGLEVGRAVAVRHSQPREV
jgi:hypothetical protein